MWASPAGKARTAAQLAALLPPHEVYVEPFAGSAAVLFAKPPTPTEVVSDIDPEIAEAFRIAASLAQADVEWLQGRDWTGDKATFRTVKAMQPTSDTERLYRFIYTNHFSFLKRRNHFSPGSAGKNYPIAKRLSAALPRLAKVKSECGDYGAIVRKYDSEQTAFFFDPPYAGTDGGVGEETFDEGRFFEVLQGLQGKFLLTYGARGSLVGLCKKAGFSTRRQFWQRDHAQTAGLSGAPRLPTYLVANFDLPSPAAAQTYAFAKALPIVENKCDERFLLGVVLEPDVVDAHQDIYGAEDIRKAAHGFMENSQQLGHMHRWQLNDQVKIVESYLLPEDCKMAGVWLRKGTWMLGVRVLDNELWASVRRNEITGFSVGGVANRVPLTASQKGVQ